MVLYTDSKKGKNGGFQAHRQEESVHKFVVRLIMKTRFGHTPGGDWWGEASPGRRQGTHSHVSTCWFPGAAFLTFLLAL